MDLLQFTSWIATAVTVGFFATGIHVCMQFRTNKSTGDIPILPFLSAGLNALLWTSYGIMKSDYTVTLVNAIGLLLQSTYVVVYYGYTINREKVKRQLLATVLVAGGILSYVKYIGMSSEEWALFHLGVICNIVTVVMFGSPLASMAMVVRTKSTKSMSFPISTAMVLVGGIWLVYGVLVGDLFIEVPNFCGVVLGLIQLSLFALYQKTSGNTLSV